MFGKIPMLSYKALPLKLPKIDLQLAAQVRAAILSSSDWNRVPAVGLKLATPNAIANALLDDPLTTIASDNTDVVNITDKHFRQGQMWMRLLGHSS